MPGMELASVFSPFCFFFFLPEGTAYAALYSQCFLNVPAAATRAEPTMRLWKTRWGEIPILWFPRSLEARHHCILYICTIIPKVWKLPDEKKKKNSPVVLDTYCKYRPRLLLSTYKRWSDSAPRESAELHRPAKNWVGRQAKERKSFEGCQ